MAIVRFTLDPNNPPKLTEEERARLDAMTDEEITAAAESDPDNPPLTEAEFEIFDDVNFIRSVREKTGLSQAKFAEAYQINPARLRDLEQGRTRPDSAMRAYLTIIARRPDMVAALDEGPLEVGGATMGPKALEAVRALREKTLGARKRYDQLTQRVRKTPARAEEARKLLDEQDAARDVWARAAQEHSDFLARFPGRNG